MSYSDPWPTGFVLFNRFRICCGEEVTSSDFGKAAGWRCNGDCDTMHTMRKHFFTESIGQY